MNEQNPGLINVLQLWLIGPGVRGVVTKVARVSAEAVAHRKELARLGVQLGLPRPCRRSTAASVSSVLVRVRAGPSWTIVAVVVARRLLVRLMPTAVLRRCVRGGGVRPMSLGCRIRTERRAL